MMRRLISMGAAIACVIGVSCGSAYALTMKECSTKYQAAKTAGTLNGQSWRDFRKAQCGTDAAAAPTAAPAPTTTTGRRTSPGSPVFPKGVSP